VSSVSSSFYKPLKNTMTSSIGAVVEHPDTVGIGAAAGGARVGRAGSLSDIDTVHDEVITMFFRFNYWLGSPQRPDIVDVPAHRHGCRHWCARLRAGDGGP
jgi:hypothetical protein